MRGVLRTFGWFVGLAAVLGCHHDKYNIKPEAIEEYYLPPDEARYNLPNVAPYKKPPQQKDKDTMMGGSKGGAPGGGLGGMGGF